ncbi:putative fungal-specific transcription factor [Lophiotrema nucula]|uniref:Putative fungal-specific transcription factor n=1 Tax=Lophiotrema nucula TaxID=690887 RepID=A0A6A5YXQ2_9PLEO|nr:putative fungal-specific transcription factor [Lophiotrema nucula]
MQTPDSSPSALAPQACSPCRIRKRRCDKALPQCSNCARRRGDHPCDYSRPDPQTPSAEPPWCEDDQTDFQTLDFPTALFLDPSILQHGQLDLPRGAKPIPAHIQQLLGDADEIRPFVDGFFGNIHPWMPFVSKKRVYGLYLRPSRQSQPDTVLLLLALKLLTTRPPDPRSPRTALYYAVKHYYLDVENSNTFSVPVLQAGIVLSLYEVLHAIYPAAFLSIGACARYSHALGINVSTHLNTKKVLTLVEVEERRRAWWAIVILDRFVSIGCPGRPFATTEPRLEDVLPVDDDAWDQGVLGLGEIHTLSTPMTSHMSKFALICQAARLLGQVLDLVSRDTTVDEGISAQLDRTLHSMLTAALNVSSPDHDQIAFIYSTIIALYAPSLGSQSADSAGKPYLQRANATAEFVTATISVNLIEQQCQIGRNPERMSPWGLFFAYHICRVHLRSRRSSSVSAEIVRSLTHTFQNVATRWNIASVYLQLLEAYEAMDKNQ